MLGNLRWGKLQGESCVGEVAVGESYGRECVLGKFRWGKLWEVVLGKVPINIVWPLSTVKSDTYLYIFVTR